LPYGQRSGLATAIKILEGIDDIAIHYLTDKDVVRHHLVQKIILAYDAYDREQAAKRRQNTEKQDARDNRTTRDTRENRNSRDSHDSRDSRDRHTYRPRRNNS
ncbi:MAG: PhoH family protein, partial [Clostridia bacterium]|nr:PhoH family protein [Clostridia bacterium]